MVCIGLIMKNILMRGAHQNFLHYQPDAHHLNIFKIRENQQNII